jgi:hypothetical protein
MRINAKKNLLLMVLAFGGCAAQPRRHVTSAADSKLDAYFQRYCGYTGNMGIGFIARDTYDYQFRQRLASTQDPELKRLFVLFHLYDDVDQAISALEESTVRVGKDQWRDMSPAEREAARQAIVNALDDLNRFDPGDPQHEIAEFRERLQKT